MLVQLEIVIIIKIPQHRCTGVWVCLLTMFKSSSNIICKAELNSTSFTKANEEEKKDIKPLLQEIYDFILAIDEKVKAKAEITEEDKTKTADLYTNLAKAIEISRIIQHINKITRFKVISSILIY